MGQRSLSRDSYKKNITLEKKFSKSIKSILGNQFIIQAPILDKYEGTDFAIMKSQLFKAGIRLRRYYYYQYDNGRYRQEFTIRWELPSSNRTEIHKIRDSLVDHILYGFVDAEEKHIIQYFIGNLKIFILDEPKPYQKRWNNPPDSRLAAYRLIDMPEDFIIKSWPESWAKFLTLEKARRGKISTLVMKQGTLFEVKTDG